MQRGWVGGVLGFAAAEGVHQRRDHRVLFPCMGTDFSLPSGSSCIGIWRAHKGLCPTHIIMKLLTEVKTARVEPRLHILFRAFKGFLIL